VSILSVWFDPCILDILWIGKAYKLRGRYLDVEQDVTKWAEQADEVIAKDLNHLRVHFLPEYDY
jgi:hypothetical protein